MKTALITIRKTGSFYYYYDPRMKIDGTLPLVSGDLTGLSGDVDDCEITPEEREHGKGISIESLIK